jgi:NADH dehydrogenase/NADH:ubiquinone oxidoreductase subunit G
MENYNRNLFGEIEKLIKIKILDKEYEVPDKLELLRVFQFLDFTIDYAKLCWNGSCHRCIVHYEGDKRTSSIQGKPSEAMSCRLKCFENMKLTKLPPTIKTPST